MPPGEESGRCPLGLPQSPHGGALFLQPGPGAHTVPGRVLALTVTRWAVPQPQLPQELSRTQVTEPGMCTVSVRQEETQSSCSVPRGFLLRPSKTPCCSLWWLRLCGLPWREEAAEPWLSSGRLALFTQSCSLFVCASLPGKPAPLSLPLPPCLEWPCDTLSA